MRLTDWAHVEARALGGSLFSGPRQVLAWIYLVHEAGSLGQPRGRRFMMPVQNCSLSDR